MDQNERQEGRLTIDRDAQINVVVNAPREEDTVDLGNVFHNMKLKSRIFAWVLVLCIVIGIAAPLLLYQINPPMLTATSVVTLKYDVAREQTINGRRTVTYSPAKDLTAPDGSGELDLNQITSAYVLQQALEGLELSQPVTLAMLRKNISIERVLTDESRRAQELASKMVDDKNNAAYDQIQNVKMVYDNKFVVRLTNGFISPTVREEDAKKLVLEDDEVRLLLDRILSAYNDYLVTTYANIKLPDDEISVIDTENLDLLESLELLQTASDNLYEYCRTKSNAVRSYRSYKDGRNLNDWMKTIQTGREISINYLYSYVYNNSIVRNKDSMITNYQFLLRNTQSQLDVVNGNVATVQSILEKYKNDEIYVSMQESDTAKSTKTTTDYYNDLILQQASNYENVAKLETTIANLNDKLSNLTSGNTKAASVDFDLNTAEDALQQAIATCKVVYSQVKAHMEELMDSPFYTTYAEHTVPQDKLQNFIVANLKKMIIGGLAGAVVGCGLWFFAALAPEFRKARKDEDEGKEAAAV